MPAGQLSAMLPQGKLKQRQEAAEAKTAKNRSKRQKKKVGGGPQPPRACLAIYGPCIIMSHIKSIRKHSRPYMRCES
jgi:hypothetical protein